jgi:hypothetical protein
MLDLGRSHWAASGSDGKILFWTLSETCIRNPAGKYDFINRLSINMKSYLPDRKIDYIYASLQILWSVVGKREYENFFPNTFMREFLVFVQSFVAAYNDQVQTYEPTST